MCVFVCAEGTQCQDRQRWALSLPPIAPALLPSYLADVTCCAVLRCCVLRRAAGLPGMGGTPGLGSAAAAGGMMGLPGMPGEPAISQ